jgi:hypothetical protein
MAGVLRSACCRIVWQWKFAQLERWGFPILLVLLFTGILGEIMNPLVAFAARAIETLFGLY